LATPLQAFPSDEHAGVWWQIDWRQIMDRLGLHNEVPHFGHAGTGGSVSALQPSRSSRLHVEGGGVSPPIS